MLTELALGAGMKLLAPKATAQRQTARCIDLRKLQARAT
jgi:hypothetical protein